RPRSSTLFPYTTLFRSFDRAMGVVEHRPARRLVDAAALHADETVLDQVEAADAVGAAQLVEPRQQRGGRERHAVDGDGIALLERSEEHTSELQSRENLV